MSCHAMMITLTLVSFYSKKDQKRLSAKIGYTERCVSLAIDTMVLSSNPSWPSNLYSLAKRLVIRSSGCFLSECEE